jgi:outer membrane receptor protein involved in Fe transport
MHKSFVKLFLLVVATVLATAFGPAAFAQAVSSGITGLVRTSDGKPVSGVTVTAVHTPTNASYSDTTNASGRFSFSGLPVGGPYTVTTKAEGYSSEPLKDVTTELGTSIDLNLTVKSDVLTLEKFVATGSRTALDASALGSSTILTAARLAAKPTTQRSLADLVSATPTITLRALSGDREDAMITAAGQNNRYNSVMIDGNRINDQFGLNSSGLASFFNPISLETLEQLSVQLSPYDTRYSGFTGASINAVTKSGTNEFHGSAYYIFSGDHLAGLQMQGPNDRALAATGQKVIPKLERTTKGLTLGGPIWKDHLFFFLNWEKFNRIGAPNAAGMPVVNATDLATIDARVAQISQVNFGSLGGNANSVANEEKKLLKLDWNINGKHRLSARYSTTDGQVPQFGSFTTTSYGSGNDVSPNTLVGGPATAYDSHFYAQKRKEKSLSAQLFSDWTPDFKTELKWSHVKQDQYTPTAINSPEVDIFGVKGINQQGQAVTNGVVVLGTERFRHGNQINVDTKNYSANGDYTWGNFTFTSGADMEDNHYYNLFRQYSYGVIQYASPAAFAADTPIAFQRNFTDLAIKGGYADVSQYTQSGVFGQVKWDVSPRLKFLAGLRYDWSTSDTRPVFNPQFFTDTGMRNDGTVDGATDVSPRFGFNWSVDEARTTQVHGGAGYFVGRAPWVFWSNSYGQTGLGTYTVNTIPPGGLSGYLTNSFDPKNPLGTGTQTGTSRSEIDLADDKTHMPSLWRLDLGVDHKLKFLDSVVSVDVTHSINDNTLFISNDNLKVKGTAADGRVYFVGNPGTAANAKYPNYTNIFHTSNVRAGEATYATIAWDRAMKNHWAFDLSYTRGKSTEAQANGQTTASGAWQRNAVFNQGAVETGRSDFEVKDRVQASISREFILLNGFPTTAALYYEGRSGNPYSYAYSNDMNQDGMSGNDLVAIPTGLSDARFDFSGLTAAQQTALFSFLNSSGLSKYAGGYAPKNAFYQPWVNSLSLRLVQSIPLHLKKSKLDLILDFTNFGSFLSKSLFNDVLRAPSSVNDVFDRRLVGNATITSTGLIKPTSFAPSDFLIDDVMSRWRIQLEAKLSF